MLKGLVMRWVFALLAALFIGSICVGCNWAHIRRHILKIRDDLRKMHEDFDRLICDMEPLPAESSTPYPTEW